MLKIDARCQHAGVGVEEVRAATVLYVGDGVRRQRAATRQASATRFERVSWTGVIGLALSAANWSWKCGQPPSPDERALRPVVIRAATHCALSIQLLPLRR
jgi:hypothetical protein